MIVLVCGSRTWKDPATIRDRIGDLPLDTTIISGMASGADRFAADIAKDNGLPVIEMPANWARDGRRAGLERNLKMLDENPDLVIAFWDGASKGTKYTLDHAARRKIPIEVIYPRRASNFGRPA